MNDAVYWKAKPHRADYDEVRDGILEAAWEEASAEGVERLTLASVARRAGCARSSIYRYFDSKEELLGSALSHRIVRFGQEMQAYIADFRDPADKLVEGIYEAVAAVRSSPALQLFRFLEGDDGLQRAGLTLGHVPAVAREVLYIDPIFTEGRAAGRVRPELSDDEILQWLVMIALSLSLCADFGSDPVREKAYLRKMLTPSIFLD